ncbi:MAG TPA: hypothetical protein VFH92_01755 [Phenylobacterium sp.]|nr:hypothetical protein [Phenylobacterium sp.]
MTGKFAGCIEDAVKAGDVDKDLAGELRQAYDDAIDAVGETLSPEEADRHAGQAVMTALEQAKLRETRLRALNVRARRAALENLAEFKTRRGYTDVKPLGGGGGARPPKDGWVQGGKPPPKGPYAGGKAAADYLIELVDGQGGVAGAPGASWKGRYQAIRGQLDAMMADLIERFETKTGFDQPGRATLENVVREAFGEDTGDQAAKGLAQAWDGAADHARKRFNAAGGEIGKLEHWGLPQSHDPLPIRAAGRDGWIEATLPRLDRGRMIDRVTELPFTEKRLRAVLGDVWSSIVTGGMDDLKPGEHMGQGRLANRRAEHRFLVFKDAQSWLAYQKEFGRSDPFAAMMGHLDGIARDTARMQVFGPNPDHQFKWLSDFAEREARVEEELHGADKAYANARSAVNTAGLMYRTLTGEISGPYGRNVAAAALGGAVRSYLSAAQLGSAVLLDVTSNPIFAAQTRAFTGLSKAGDFKAWADHVFHADSRAMARRSGFIVEGARAQLHGSMTDALRMHTVGGKILAGVNAFTRRLPVAVMRAQGLSGNMAASRWAFQHEFMGALFDRRGKTIAQMLAGNAEDRAFGQTLQARGFTEAEWAKIAATPPDVPAEGAEFITPAAVGKAHGEELGWRVAEMIERQTRLAVPEASLWSRAHLIRDTRPGTFWGELTRSIAAYRSFTVTQTYLWSREFTARAMDKPNWGLTAAAQAAPMMIALTVGGALAIGLRDIVKGNDPRPMDTPQFWAAALTQGGGLGILGDFFYAAQARNGKSSSLTSLGTGAALVSDLYDLTVGNVAETVQGVHDGRTLDDAVAHANPGRDAAKMLARYSPLSSIWWLRAAWDRAVVDQLQKLMDPAADAEFQRQAQRQMRDYGMDQWWPEGQALPSRAPDVASAVAARR